MAASLFARRTMGRFARFKIAALALVVAVGSSIGFDAAAAPSGQAGQPSRVRRIVDAGKRQVFTRRWRQPVVRTGSHRTVNAAAGGPVVSVARGLVLVPSSEGAVLGLALRTGRRVWRFDYRAPVSGSGVLVPAADAAAGKAAAVGALDELFVVGAQDGVLLALSVTTGELVWSAKIGGDPRAPAVHHEDRLLVTTQGGRLVAVSRRTGDVLWVKQRPPAQTLTVAGSSKPWLHEGLAYVTFADGFVAAYRVSDGSEVWARPLSLSDATFIDADADPVVAGDRLFVASYADGVMALHPKTGELLWSAPLASAVQLVMVDDELLLAASADGTLLGLRQRDGGVVYRTGFPAGPVSRMVSRGGMVVFSSGRSGLMVVNGRTGEPLQATGLASDAAGDVSWDQDVVAVLSTGGYVHLFHAQRAGQ